MKKIILFVAALLLVSCDKDEVEDKIKEYKNKPKSEDLKGFWQLKGFYKSDKEKPNDEAVINNGNVAGIGLDEILFMDNMYLRFLNKSQENDEVGYYLNKRERLYWYNDDKFIKSLHQDEYGNKYFDYYQEFQLPYRFGETKDTLIIQSNGRVVYLLKTDEVEYIEYSFE